MGIHGHLLLEIENIQGEGLKIFKVHLKLSKGQVSLNDQLLRFLLALTYIHLCLPDAGFITYYHFLVFLRGPKESAQNKTKILIYPNLKI